jgi:hypothetical protein
MLKYLCLSFTIWENNSGDLNLNFKMAIDKGYAYLR